MHQFVCFFEQNNNNEIIVISAINFVISEDGIYVNWFATNESLYHSSTWPCGDNSEFSNRGLGTILLNSV